MSQEFSRSVVAQSVAAAIVDRVREREYIRQGMVALPALAEGEKELLVKMLARLGEMRGTGRRELDTDEIVSLFTFVFARAAEAVTNLVNRRPNEFQLMGMLDGKVPLYADERLTGYFKQSGLPSDCAEAYLEWFAAHGADPAVTCLDPLLPLFEALKWCFRFSCAYAVEKLEADGRQVPGV